MMLAISTACRHPPASARPGRTPTTGRRVIPAVMAGRRARAVAVRSVDDAKDDGSSAEVDARADEEAEQPRRTFGSDVEAIAARGLAGALPEGSRVITVDKQLVSDDASGGGAGFAFDELASFTLKNYNTHESSAWVYSFRRTGGAAEGGRNLS